MLKDLKVHCLVPDYSHNDDSMFQVSLVSSTQILSQNDHEHKNKVSGMLGQNGTMEQYCSQQPKCLVTSAKFYSSNPSGILQSGKQHALMKERQKLH